MDSFYISASADASFCSADVELAVNLAISSQAASNVRVADGQPSLALARTALLPQKPDLLDCSTASLHRFLARASESEGARISARHRDIKTAIQTADTDSSP